MSLTSRTALKFAAFGSLAVVARVTVAFQRRSNGGIFRPKRVALFSPLGIGRRLGTPHPKGTGGAYYQSTGRFHAEVHVDVSDESSIVLTYQDLQ